MPTHPTPRLARFGLFELDLRTGELRKKSSKVHLQEQPFQVLSMLVERAGDVVMREELRQRLWPEAVFVDFDIGLSKAVAKIRIALGDSAASPRFVETLERHGYRFIADVILAEAPAGAASAREAVPPPRSAGPAYLLRLIWDDRCIALPEGVHIIGRDPPAAVRIDSPVVSRRQASLSVRATGVSIEDHGSRNGTYVNGVRLGSPRALSQGDEIRVGQARLMVRLQDPLELTATEND